MGRAVFSQALHLSFKMSSVRAIISTPGATRLYTGAKERHLHGKAYRRLSEDSSSATPPPATRQFRWRRASNVSINRFIGVLNVIHLLIDLKETSCSVFDQLYDSPSFSEMLFEDLSLRCIY